MLPFCDFSLSSSKYYLWCKGNAGFYDRINAEDEVVLISLPKDEQKNPSEDIGLTDVTPAADSNGNPVSKKELGLTAEDLGVRRIPSFIELIRSIY